MGRLRLAVPPFFYETLTTLSFKKMGVILSFTHPLWLSEAPLFIPRLLN